jgi:hypothetical protein
MIKPTFVSRCLCGHLVTFQGFNEDLICPKCETKLDIVVRNHVERPISGQENKEASSAG